MLGPVIYFFVYWKDRQGQEHYSRQRVRFRGVVMKRALLVTAVMSLSMALLAPVHAYELSPSETQPRKCTYRYEVAKVTYTSVKQQLRPISGVRKQVPGGSYTLTKSTTRTVSVSESVAASVSLALGVQASGFIGPVMAGVSAEITGTLGVETGLTYTTEWGLQESDTWTYPEKDRGPRWVAHAVRSELLKDLSIFLNKVPNESGCSGMSLRPITVPRNVVIPSETIEWVVKKSPIRIVNGVII